MKRFYKILLVTIFSILTSCSKDPTKDEIDFYQYMKPDKNGVYLHNFIFAETGITKADRIYKVSDNKFSITYLKSNGDTLSEMDFEASGDKIKYVHTGPMGINKGHLKRYINQYEKPGEKFYQQELINTSLKYNGLGSKVVGNSNCIQLQGSPSPDVIDHKKTAITFSAYCKGVGLVMSGASIDGVAQVGIELVSSETAKP